MPPGADFAHTKSLVQHFQLRLHGWEGAVCEESCPSCEGVHISLKIVGCSVACAGIEGAREPRANEGALGWMVPRERTLQKR